HRFVDAQDGHTYLYSYLWPYYANRMFPSFDQPNLKAEFELQVRAPPAWTVVSTAAGNPTTRPDGSVHWQFAKTPKLSTYVFSLHAGPYAVWEDRAGDIALRLMARRSLAQYVEADEWFEVTRGGLAYFGDYFDIPYPFGKYDQLIVPDFNIGAMENVAAVTFTENYVQRGESDRTQREDRANVILHEMAHMWFGNLVTHDWWNGLWLNESFATQMAAMAMIETTEFTDRWHGFFTNAKRAAYYRDSRVTTHPIEMPVATTADFFTVFDAITYQKGSSVLKQLMRFVGEENYRRGVSAYLKAFSYRSTALQDFVSHQSDASGIDLADWSERWLNLPGFNRLRVGVECDDDRMQWLFLQQLAPADQPYLRRHKVEVGIYDAGRNGKPLPARVFAVDIEGINTSIEVLDDVPCPVLVNPNHDDWTYARVELTDRNADYLQQHLPDIPEPFARSIFLAALFDRAMAGDMPLSSYVAQAMKLAESETNIRVIEQISQSVTDAIDMMMRLRPDTDAALERLLPAVERAALAYAAGSDSSDLQLNWLNTWLRIVSSDAGLAIVRSLLDGSSEIPGIPVSSDARWALLTILSSHGAADIEALLRAESGIDKSDFAAKSLLAARAARPDLTIKASLLAALQESETLTGLANQRAVMSSMFPPHQTALHLDLLDDVLDALPGLSQSADPYFLSSYVSSLLAPICRRESSDRMQQALDDFGERLDSTSLRFLREAQQADQECAALRPMQ
ncbi:MAG: aminopeptidase N, partial [Gammaproteobacteria bacterium]|nr:aminopeptidase N [Gammaproteobacteria bacterium]